MKFNTSLNAKINIVGGIVLFIFMIMLISFYFVQNFIVNNKNFIENYSNYTKILSSQSNLFFLTYDESDLNNINQLNNIFQSIDGYIFFNDKEKIYEKYNNNIDWPIDQNIMFLKYKNDNDGIVYESKNKIIFKHTIYSEYSIDDSYSKNLLGYSFILVNSNLTNNNQKQYFYLVAIFIVFFIIIWFLYNKFLKYNLLNPIMDLSNSMELAIKGIYFPVKIKTDNKETLNMANTFNIMLNKIQENEKNADDLIKDANRKMEEKIEFSSTLSHEIRTPLLGIIGTLDLIDKNSLNDSNLRDIERVISSARHLQQITDDALNISKYSLDEIEFHDNTVNFCDLLNNCINIHLSNAKNKNLSIQAHYDSKLPLYFELDETKVQQMISNILSNAIKFTHKGFVSVEARLLSSSEHSCQVDIIISDSGVGIASDKIKSIFEPYKQANGSSNRTVGGTGLGLYISQKIAILMGGEIKVESFLDQGSKFIISLELKTSERKSVSLDFNKKSLKSIKENKKIVSLIYDDILNEFTRKLFDCYNVDYFNDINNLIKSDIQKYNVLITDQNIDSFLSNFNKDINIIQLNKNFESSENLPLYYPFNKNQLNEYIEEFFIKKEQNILFDYQKMLNKNNILKKEEIEKFGNLSILVVDDNSTNQKIITKTLEKCHQTNVICVDNGQKAIDLFKRNNFDIIFMDCQMPIKDGYDATQEIREIEQSMGIEKTLIVAVTANNQDSEIQKCKDIGMSYFISKPFNIKKIENTLLKIKNKDYSSFIINE